MGIKRLMMLFALLVGLGVSGMGVGGDDSDSVIAARSEQYFARAAGSENLFEASHWVKNAPYFHFQDAPLVQRIRSQVVPLVHLEQRTLPGGDVELHIEKDQKIETLAGANASNISGSWKYPLTFQPGDLGPFVIEFDYEAVSSGTYPTRACMLLYYMRNGKTVTLRAKPIKLVSGKRSAFRTTLDVVPETDGVQIHLRFDGCGHMTFINPRLFREKNDQPAAGVALIP